MEMVSECHNVRLVRGTVLTLLPFWLLHQHSCTARIHHLMIPVTEYARLHRHSMLLSSYLSYIIIKGIVLHCIRTSLAWLSVQLCVFSLFSYSLFDAELDFETLLASSQNSTSTQVRNFSLTDSKSDAWLRSSSSTDSSRIHTQSFLAWFANFHVTARGWNLFELNIKRTFNGVTVTKSLAENFNCSRVIFLLNGYPSTATLVGPVGTDIR